MKRAWGAWTEYLEIIQDDREQEAKELSEANIRLQLLEEDEKQKEAEIASLQAAWDKTKQEAGEYATQLEGEVEASKAKLAEARQRIQVLEEHVGRKEAEIASLQAELDKTKQEAGEYATHLEGEVEASKATLAEATQSIQALEQRGVKLTAKLDQVQATLESTKQEAGEYAAQLEEEIENAKASAEEASVELKSRDTVATRLAEELEKAQAKVRTLSVEVEASEQAVEKYRSEALEHVTAMAKLQQDVFRALDADISIEVSMEESEQVVLTPKQRSMALRSAPAPPSVNMASQSLQSPIVTSGAPDLSQVAENIKSLKQEIALKSSELQHRDHDLVSLRAELEHSQKSHEKTINESAKYISILEYELETNKSKLAQVERVRVRHVLQQHQAAAMAFCAWAEVVVVKLARQEEESIESEISRLSAALKDTRKVLFSSEGSLEKARTELKDKRKALLLSQGLLEKAHIDVASLSKELAVRKRMIEKMSDKESILLRQLEATNKQLAAICRPSDERVAALERAHQEVEGQMREQRAVSEKQLLTCLLDLDEARSALRAMHTAICDESTVQVQAGIGIALGPATVSERKGVVVTQLAKSGPAAQSGKIKVGDLLVELDGRDVSKFDVDQVKEIIKGGVGLPLRFKAQRPNSSSQYEVILERNSGSGSSASMSDTHSIPSSAAGSSPGQFTSPGKARSAGSSQFVSPGKVSVSSQVGENWLLRAGLGIESPRYRILAKTGAIPR